MIVGCITTDVWTSNSQFSYLSCTLHYINNKFEFSSRVLGLYYLDQPHNANYLFEKLKEILNEWNTSENIIEDISKHIPCVAHKLNSCVSDMFKIKEIKNYINNNKNVFKVKCIIILIKSFCTLN